MLDSRTMYKAATLLAALLVQACGTDGSEASRAAFDRAGSGSSLPAGHPPIESPPAAEGGPSPAMVAGVAWTVPAGWEDAGSRSMRVATYTIRTNREGTAECAVFYFGSGQGGDVQSNIDRWLNQIEQPDGTSTKERARTAQREQSGWPLSTVDVSGTYNGGMASSPTGQPAQPGYRLLGAIVEGPQGPVFFKLTGPEAVVEASVAGFQALLESIRPARAT